MEAKKKTILIVEDSKSQALSLRCLLDGQGLKVVHAEDGDRGVAMAQEILPDAIVLDIVMPNMDGFEVCKILKGNPQTVDIPIIMFTCHDDTNNLQESVNLGAVDFIPKDVFSDAVLLETLRQLGVLDKAQAG